ncbi:GNAT family N-acetyltransferase [Acutalibacter caecimuris]|uniref:GNAT family N-acetyltransferase n=1 Tax=Acutalibacter caecimuris TaxID=3093657 RepID=UPI002AC8FAF8|nr:GNAT family N-acetyltransferase [Acutalibacter sp. M00118]
MTIIPATRSDLPAIRKLYEELNACMAALQHNNFRPAQQNEDFILSMLADESSDFLTAKTETGAMMGFALVQAKVTPPHPSFIPRAYTYLMDIVVTESCRRQGVGYALLEEVMRWAQGRGSEFIELGVLSENSAAIKVYEKFGFAERRKIMEFDLTQN